MKKMHEWIDKLMHEWADEDEWMHEWMNIEQSNAQINVQT